MAGAVTAQKKLRHCKRVVVGPHWQILASAVASAATNKATTESSANLGFCHSSPASLWDLRFQLTVYHLKLVGTPCSSSKLLNQTILSLTFYRLTGPSTRTVSIGKVAAGGLIVSKINKF